MSQVIDFRLYDDSNQLSIESLLSGIVDAVAAWNCTEGEWQGLRIAQTAFANVVEQVQDRFDSNTLKKILSERQWKDDQWISTGIGFKCWRFEHQQPEPGFLRLGVEVWGAGTERLQRGEPWIEGNARITISKAGPYWAVVGNKDFPAKDKCNSRVVENVDSLIQLVVQLANRLNVKSIKAFVDAGDFLPLNCHIAYYSDRIQTLADLSKLAIAWAVGIPKHKIPPIRSILPGKSWVLSELRSPAQQENLWQRLADAWKLYRNGTEAIVAEVLESKVFDVHQLNRGFIVTNYPYCFNAFIDDLFIEVMKRGSARVDPMQSP
jgi:hypothetical protein